MASTTLDLLAPVHRLSIDDYRRMHEVGLFDGDLRVELIEGVVVEMSPIGRSHERAVTWLDRALVLQLAETELVSPQNSIVLAELRSMPQPDIAIRTAAEMLERAADRPLLIIEVADSSLRFDRITKSRLYARHGIEDYWIVNVADEAVEVHRDPAGDASDHAACTVQAMFCGRCCSLRSPSSSGRCSTSRQPGRRTPTAPDTMHVGDLFAPAKAGPLQTPLPTRV